MAAKQMKTERPAIRNAEVTDSDGNVYTLGTNGQRVWLSNQHRIPLCLSNLTSTGNGYEEQRQTIIGAVLGSDDIADALNKCTYYTNWRNI